jgi:hypothetical protein
MSTAKFDTLSTLDGSQSVPVNTVAQGSAKAWVNFNGTGTVAIRASFNVTSITDNGTGSYTINFTTALPDANYVVSGTASPVLPDAGNGYRWVAIGSGINADFSMLTTSVRIQVVYDASNKTDGTTVTAAIFR